MPIILTPLHFDRDPLQKQPSCQRSVVIRTFITSDFMTGIAATPGNEIPEEVIRIQVFKFLFRTIWCCRWLVLPFFSISWLLVLILILLGEDLVFARGGWERCGGALGRANKMRSWQWFLLEVTILQAFQHSSAEIPYPGEQLPVETLSHRCFFLLFFKL